MGRLGRYPWPTLFSLQFEYPFTISFVESIDDARRFKALPAKQTARFSHEYKMSWLRKREAEDEVPAPSASVTSTGSHRNKFLALHHINRGGAEDASAGIEFP